MFDARTAFDVCTLHADDDEARHKFQLEAFLIFALVIQER